MVFWWLVGFEPAIFVIRLFFEGAKEMKLKLAICDDEAKQREYVLGLMNAWAKLGRHLLEIKEVNYQVVRNNELLLLEL